MDIKIGSLNLSFGFNKGSERSKRANSSERITNKLIEQYNYRIRQDVQSWKLALQNAENPLLPRRILLYNLYDAIILDNHVFSMIEHGIKDKLFGQQFKIVKEDTNEEVPEMTKFFQGRWFYKFVELALESQYYGHSLIQIGDLITPPNGQPTIDEVCLVPRRHVKPETGEILIYQWDNSGIPYRKDKQLMSYLVEVGAPKDLGIFNKAAVPYIFKKNTLMAWSEYTEIFGMPMRYAVTPSRAKEDMDRLEGSLKKMGSAAYAVVNSDEELKFLETTKTDAYQVYDQLIDRTNSELSKLLVGQTMGHDNGSSRSQAEVHERMAQEVIQSKKRFITSVTNDQLMDVITGKGVNMKGLKLEYVEQRDLNDLFKMVQAFGQNYRIPANYIEETFGIPVEELEEPAEKPVPGNPPTAPEEQEEEEEDKPTKGKKPAKKPDKKLNDILKLHLAIDELHNPK